MTNLTVADHPDGGVKGFVASGAEAGLANAIVWNATVGASVPVSSSLVGVDPLFVDAASGDYALSAGSPAIGCGTPTPPGGLGATDLSGDPRATEGRVDCGALQYAPEPGALASAALASVAALARRRRKPRDARRSRRG